MRRIICSFDMSSSDDAAGVAVGRDSVMSLLLPAMKSVVSGSTKKFFVSGAAAAVRCARDAEEAFEGLPLDGTFVRSANRADGRSEAAHVPSGPD